MKIFLVHILGPVLLLRFLFYHGDMPFIFVNPLLRNRIYKVFIIWSEQVRAPLSLCHDFMPLESPDQSYNMTHLVTLTQSYSDNPLEKL